MFRGTLNGIVGYIKKKKKKKGKILCEQSSIVIRTNVAGWNAYVNEPARLPDKDGVRGDDAVAIETSRPDTKKAKEEKYRIIVVIAHTTTIDVLNPRLFLARWAPAKGGSREQTCTHTCTRSTSHLRAPEGSRDGFWRNWQTDSRRPRI